MPKVTIDKLEIRMGKRVVPMTLEEARELHRQLDELFGKATPIVMPAPVVIERPRWPNPWGPIWCGETKDNKSDYQRHRDSLPQVWCHSGSVDDLTTVRSVGNSLTGE